VLRKVVAHGRWGDVDPQRPTGITIAIGAVVVIAAAFPAALVPSGDPVPRFALMTLGLTLFAMATRDWLAVAAVVPLAWLVYDGFLLDRFGVLAWRGRGDVVRFGLLAGAALLGLAMGVARHKVEDRRTRWALGAEVHALVKEREKEMGRG
jgi:hypothetical protein